MFPGLRKFTVVHQVAALVEGYVYLPEFREHVELEALALVVFKPLKETVVVHIQSELSFDHV